MIQFTRFSLAGLVALLITGCGTPEDPAKYAGATIYKGAMVWDNDGFEQRDFAMKDGVFLEAPRKNHPDMELMNLEGRYVMPPFGEGHTHKIEGTWSFERFNNEFFTQGVFYAQNPAGLPRLMKLAREQTDPPETIDAKYAMGGVTTPFGHPERGYVEFMTQFAYRGETRESFRGTAVHALKTEEDAREAIDILVQDKADFVKVFLEFSEEYDERSARLEAA
ncbi:MAG: hypothetical protein AAGA69_01090, partial [Pseudomonadota bacterium]